VAELKARLARSEEAPEADRERALAAEMAALDGESVRRIDADDKAHQAQRESTASLAQLYKLEGRAAEAEARLREALDEVDVLRPHRARAEALDRQLAKARERSAELADMKQKLRRAEDEVAAATKRACKAAATDAELARARAELDDLRDARASLEAGLCTAESERAQARADATAHAAAAQRADAAAALHEAQHATAQARRGGTCSVNLTGGADESDEKIEGRAVLLITARGRAPARTAFPVTPFRASPDVFLRDGQRAGPALVERRARRLRPEHSRRRRRLDAARRRW
jgi:hypothetical protein